MIQDNVFTEQKNQNSREYNFQGAVLIVYFDDKIKKSSQFYSQN